MKRMIDEQFPERWGNLFPVILKGVSSGEVGTVFGSLVAVYMVAKKLEYSKGEARGRYAVPSPRITSPHPPRVRVAFGCSGALQCFSSGAGGLPAVARRMPHRTTRPRRYQGMLAELLPSLQELATVHLSDGMPESLLIVKQILKIYMSCCRVRTAGRPRLVSSSPPNTRPISRCRTFASPIRGPFATCSHPHVSRRPSAIWTLTQLRCPGASDALWLATLPLLRSSASRWRL